MAVHALSFGVALLPDEGGYLLVARQWHGAGPLLYGQLWVDRPPLLLVAFMLAGWFGPMGIHALACLCSGATVAAAGWAGYAVGGSSAAKWCALTAGALSASTLLGTQELDGELLATPLVMTSCALMLHAVYRSRSGSRRLALAAIAGVVAVGAVLMKQNFVDALVFGTVLLLPPNPRLPLPLRHRFVLLATFLGSAAAAAGTVAVWAQSRGQLHALWFASYAFRAEAGAVISAGSWHAPQRRLVALLGLALLSGIAFFLAGVLTWHRKSLWRADPWAVAMLAALLVEVAGIALGGSFWPHYLIGVIPMLALGAGIAPEFGGGAAAAAMRALIVAATAVTLVAAPIHAYRAHAHTSEAEHTATWLRQAAHRSDSVIVTFGHPNVIEASGLATDYPYAWSLPVRTLDPTLSRFDATVVGAHAPTWIVEWEPINTWQLDPSHRVRQDMVGNYQLVAHVCGHPVWLHNGISRPIPTAPAC